MQKTSIDIIQSPETDSLALIRAIQSLGEKPVPASFWNGIADSDAFRMAHRKQAVIQLVKRHAKEGMDLREFLDLFRGQNWWRQSKVEIVPVLFGHLPVVHGIDRTVIKINVLPEDAEANLCLIYFSVQPVMGPADFDAYFSDPALSGNRYQVLEIGFAGDLLDDNHQAW